jgi:ectoine hydroxylase-related dioxygenase (phytanoyl-CoA dioxygenase family)
MDTSDNNENIDIESLFEDSKCETVFVVENFVTEKELSFMRHECDKYYPSDADVSELGAAVDLFEHNNLREDHEGRIDDDEYFKQRWLGEYVDIHSEKRLVFQNLILSRLPSLLKLILKKSFNYSVENLFLFNEHYVVKLPQSNVAFRWHRDCDEQLGALPQSYRPLYYSAWCPLDDVVQANGTLSIAHTTNVVKIVASQLLESEQIRLVDDAADQNQSLNSFSCIGAKGSTKSKRDLEGNTFNESKRTRSLPVVEDRKNVDLSEYNIEISAGSVVFFTSTLWHRSGINASSEKRRVYYAQYSTDMISPDHIHSREGQRIRPLCFAVKCNAESLV